MRSALPAALALALVIGFSPLVRAGEPAAKFVESHLYFGLDDGSGKRVSQEEWQRFVREVITPAFPAGLTIVTAYGQSRATDSRDVTKEDTRILIVVHEAGEAAEDKLAAIEKAYLERFGIGGVFHTRAPVEVVGSTETVQ